MALVSHNRQEIRARKEGAKLVGDLSPPAGTGTGGKKSFGNQDISGHFPRCLGWGISRSWSTNSSQSVLKYPSWNTDSLSINDSPTDTAIKHGKMSSSSSGWHDKGCAPPSLWYIERFPWMAPGKLLGFGGDGRGRAEPLKGGVGEGYP